MNIEEKKFGTKNIVYIAVFSALSAMLMFIEFPIIPVAPFLKLDFSDVIILAMSFILGPLQIALMIFIKVLIHWTLIGGGFVSIVGDFASLLSSFALIFPIIMSKQRINFKNIVSSTLTLIVVASLTNYFFLLPIYMKLFNFNIGMSVSKYVLSIVIPFNLIKGLVITIITAVLFKKLPDRYKVIK